MEKKAIQGYFEEVETFGEYKGNIYSIGEALTIAILGSICGLRNMSQICQWASNDRIRIFLKEHFEIKEIPCYYWFLCLLKKVKPESLNRSFMRWTQSMLAEEGRMMTLSFDGKTICSTATMDHYESPLHIISAQIAEMGITLAQRTVAGKSNEIPALRELLEIMEIAGCMVVADALHCQRETAMAIVAKGADYLLNVKDNQEALKAEIADYIEDEALREAMDAANTIEKNSGRIERRNAYSTCDVTWLHGKENWANLACVGAVRLRVETKGKTSDEWHYYISSRPLSAGDLLRFARMEWSVESMHWLLDVHFDEDSCRVTDEEVQQNLNMIRKVALNTIRHFKNQSISKRAFSKIMLDCLLDPSLILSVLMS
jgi:predicted transposase YbfD/YdcC